MNESILISVILYLMLDPNYLSDQFRSTITDAINNQINILHQIGLESADDFYVEDESAIWSDLTEDNPRLNMVKEFIKIGVKLEFDPPTNSFLYDALKKHYDELTSRINYQVENSGRTL